MALDFGNKVENGGIPPNGVLPASEFNELVAQVNKNEEDIAAIDEPNSIESIEATESQASGGNNVVTITETNGTQTSFNVKNGNDGANGVSLGDVEIADNLTTNDNTKVLSAKQGYVLKGLLDSQTFPIVNGFEGGATNVLSAEAGKCIKENVQILLDALGNYAFPNGKPSLNWNLGLVSVALELTNVSSSNTDETAEIGEAYTTTLTCSNISNLYVADVVVKMDGVDITSTAYTPSTGVVSIAEVTGNIEITATQITYIADGLVLHLDGKNRGGSSGHWVDLIGNRDFVLDGTYDENADNIDFKGSCVAMADDGVGYLASQSTCEAIFNQTSWTSTTHQAMFASCCQGGIIVGTVNRSGSYYSYPSYIRPSSGSNINTIKSQDVSHSTGVINSLVRYGGDTKLNGTAKTNTNSVAFAYGTSREGKFILGGHGASYSFDGKIYAVRLYGRVLTADEMAQNLKVDKLRFGF